MTAPQFSQAVGEPRLYWLDDATWQPSGAFGLVLFPASGNGPATLTLPQSFVNYPGLYVSISVKPTAAQQTAFADAVLALVQQLGANTRFLWLETAQPDVNWSWRVLFVRQTSGAAQGVIDRPTVFKLGRYRFSVSAGQTIAPTADGFAVTGENAPFFQLATDDKAWPLVPAGAGQTVLSVSGATAGTFLVNGSLDATANPGGVSDYDLLDVGFRYGLLDQDDPLSYLLLSLYYPLFRGTPAQPVTISMQVDPAATFEPTRTRLSYRGSVAALDTHYTTQLGYGVTLAPNGVAAGLPAGLAFHKTPRTRSDLAEDDPLYLAPIGGFLMNVTASPGLAQPAARLTGGLSGIEYFGFSTGSSVPVAFTPAQAAFAADFPPRQPSAAVKRGLDDREPPVSALTARATTSFAALGPPSGGQAWYFAQPDGASFFQVRPADGGREGDDDPDLLPYLILLELVTTGITAAAAPYPLVPYAGATDNDLALVRALEMQVLSPLRRAALGAPGDGQLFLRKPGALLDDVATQGVTPQGILASFSGNSWVSVTLSPAQQGAVLPQLAFNAPSAALRGALQSNQLFLVAADGALLMQNAGFNYWITDAVLGDLNRLAGAEAVPQPVIALLAQSGRTPQTSLAAFTTMLQGLLTGANAQYIPVVCKYALYFQLDVEGWRFRLSPSLWAGQTTHPPVMILKYAVGSLYDFADNTGAWAWPDVAKIDGSLVTTQKLIKSILDAAIADVELHGSASKLYNFVAEVVQNPGWTGVVFLNANVPFSSVPPELAGLAAGIDPNEFRAHHVGISVTPISIDEPNRLVSQGHSAIFGLIDYDQQEDIAHIEGEFDFKVLLLQVLFVNSMIANFAGRIELFINRLFGELVTLYNSEHYNNILLNGTYQRQGTSGHYVFATGAVSMYGANSVGKGGSDNKTVLLSTEFDQAQFVTATANTVTQTTVQNRFLLQGKLRFAALNGFDAFSFGPTVDRNGITIADGYLAFSGVSVDMDFPVSAPNDRTFRFNLDEISFDPASSLARATSFFQRFPLQLTGLIRGGAAQKPRDVGYMPLETPLSQPGFSGEWFGLQLAVDLGTLGALSSAPGLSAIILAAWSPTANGHDVNVGLKMPGIESARTLLPLEGVIDLGFQAIDLQAHGATDAPPNPAYTLRFRNFYLSFLGWKFPPGQNTIMLFGNPEAATQSIAADRGALGWYAAYAKKD
jgi:hypothetical protein